MNKKGFTLVELLAVILILGVIGIVATISISAVRRRTDLKIVEGNLDVIMLSARGYGEQDINALSSSPIITSVSELKGNTELSVEDAYNNIEIKIYLYNNRASACITNKEALTDLVGESNLDSLNKYYCPESTPGPDYAEFDKGIIFYVKLAEFRRKTVVPFPIKRGLLKICPTDYCGSMIMEPYADSNYIDVSLNDTYENLLTSHEPGFDKLVHSCDDNGNCSNTFELDKYNYRIDVSSPSSPHKIYLVWLSGIQDIFYYSDVSYDKLYLNENASYMLQSIDYRTSDLKVIDGIGSWKADNVLYMSRMFYDANFTSLNLSNWNVSRVTNMTDMFGNTTWLIQLDIGSWELNSLTEASGMFTGSTIKDLKTPKYIRPGISINLPYTYTWESPGTCPSGSSSCHGAASYYSVLDSNSPKSAWLNASK